MTAPSAHHRAITVRLFTQRLSATPRGARLARRLAVSRLAAWVIPYGADASETIAAIVAELAANAATHGRVPGRDFELRLSLVPGRVRIEVADSRGERRPPGPRDVRPPHPLAEGGWGLVLVDALADRWEVLDRAPGKTVRAEVDLPGWLGLFHT
ncbi:ATP-binding protein [Streptomyces sp. NPDC052676]|uniref:ATP-binding protein n=1 Tax=Streptomyces sp. NPDC052676 TaxID=3154953 RepID=UPI00341C6CF5